MIANKTDKRKQICRKDKQYTWQFNITFYSVCNLEWVGILMKIIEKCKEMSYNRQKDSDDIKKVANVLESISQFYAILLHIYAKFLLIKLALLQA